jgi:hypothetical protein
MNIKSYALCPVSDKRVNERVARINGAFTVLLLLSSGFTKSIIPVVFLAADFLLRASDYSRYSLVGISSKGIVRYFGLNENIINAGPKIFASRLGFVMASLIIFFFVLNAYIPAIALGGVLGLFSFLEASFGFCVACEIYPYVYRLLYKVKFQ